MVSDIEMQRYRNKKIRICDKNSIPYFDKTKQKVVRRKGLYGFSIEHHPNL